MTAEEIRAIRQRLGLNQDQFARALGVTVTTVNRWERGHTRPNAAMQQFIYEFGRASAKPEIGDVVARAVVVGSAAFLLFKILEAAFGKENE